jgi:hypothetical protein
MYLGLTAVTRRDEFLKRMTEVTASFAKKATE